jgi:hypothetical protein
MLADARPVRMLVNMVRTESTDFSMRSSASSAISSTVNSSLSLTPGVGGGAMNNKQHDDDGAAAAADDDNGGLVDDDTTDVVLAVVGTARRGAKAPTSETGRATTRPTIV